MKAELRVPNGLMSVEVKLRNVPSNQRSVRIKSQVLGPFWHTCPEVDDPLAYNVITDGDDR